MAEQAVRWAIETGQTLSDYRLAVLLAELTEKRPKGILAKDGGHWKARLTAMTRAVRLARREAKKLVPVGSIFTPLGVAMVTRETMWRTPSMLGHSTASPFTPEQLAVLAKGNT